MLELLDALDHARGVLGAIEPPAWPISVPLPDSSETSTSRVADRRGVDVLERRRVGRDARDVHAALVRERVLAHVGRVRVGREVEQLREQVRASVTPPARAGSRGLLELEVGDDRVRFALPQRSP